MFKKTYKESSVITKKALNILYRYLKDRKMYYWFKKQEGDNFLNKLGYIPNISLHRRAFSNGKQELVYVPNHKLKSESLFFHGVYDAILFFTKSNAITSNVLKDYFKKKASERKCIIDYHFNYICGIIFMAFGVILQTFICYLIAPSFVLDFLAIYAVISITCLCLTFCILE